MASVIFDGKAISDWQSFNRHVVKIFGFPDFYGNNLNAFIDCLTYLTLGDGMSRFTLQGNEQLQIHITDFELFSKQQQEICSAFLECIGFINQRYLHAGDIPRLIVVPQ